MLSLTNRRLKEWQSDQSYYILPNLSYSFHTFAKLGSWQQYKASITGAYVAPSYVSTTAMGLVTWSLLSTFIDVTTMC